MTTDAGTVKTVKAKETAIQTAIRTAIEKSGEQRDSRAVIMIPHYLGQTVQRMDNNPTSALELIRLVDSIDSSTTAVEVAREIERAMQYLHDPKNVFDFCKMLPMYKDSAKAGITAAWATTARNSDNGDQEGALVVSGIMQDKEIVEVVNGLDRRVAKEVAMSLVNIANYLRDLECVKMAAKAVKDASDYTTAATLADRLEYAAENLRNPIDRSYGLWDVATEGSKQLFISNIIHATDKEALRKTPKQFTIGLSGE